MFFWFVATAVIATGFVFRDPRFDYRLLIVGSLLPLLDGFFGGARALHSVTVSIALLAALMVVTSGRKPIRKVLLGLPIGMLLHLLFDGVWSDTEVFWWPFAGVEFGEAPLPVIERGIWSVVMEAVGLVMCGWLWRINGLGRAGRRRHFLADGRLVTVAGRFS